MKILRTFGNYNPSGIVINPGWYALAGCIYCNMTVEEAIAKIIYGKPYNYEYKPRKRQKKSKMSEIRDAYKPGMDLEELAVRFNVQKSYVWKALTRAGLFQKTFYREKIYELMGKEPHLTNREVAERVGCSYGIAAKCTKEWYKLRGIGCFA